jgi:hypothetical protein
MEMVQFTVPKVESTMPHWGDKEDAKVIPDSLTREEGSVN